MPTPAARAAVAVAAVSLALVAAPRRADADAPRPLPGSVGLVHKPVALRNACVGSFRSIKKVKRGDDPAMVAALTYPRIKGLDFDPQRPARVKASTKKFEAWYENLQKRFVAARQVQERALAADGATVQAKVEAAARMAILLDQAAMLIDTVEIPPHLHAYPEARDIFCDTMAEKSEPLRDSANEARAACARFIADGALAAGWWTDVCAPVP